jgi:hypothetical protein
VVVVVRVLLVRLQLVVPVLELTETVVQELRVVLQEPQQLMLVAVEAVDRLAVLLL